MKSTELRALSLEDPARIKVNRKTVARLQTELSRRNNEQASNSAQ